MSRASAGDLTSTSFAAVDSAYSLVAALQGTLYMRMLPCARRQLTSSGGPYGHCLTTAMTFFWAWPPSWAGYLRITRRCVALKEPGKVQEPCWWRLKEGHRCDVVLQVKSLCPKVLPMLTSSQTT